MIAVTHKKESQLTCEASLNMSICPWWICMLESSLPNSLNKNHAVNLHRKNTYMYNVPSPLKNVLIKNCIVVSFYLICFCWMHWDVMMSLKQTEGKTTQNMYLYEIAVISSGVHVKSKTLCRKGSLKPIKQPTKIAGEQLKLQLMTFSWLFETEPSSIFFFYCYVDQNRKFHINKTTKKPFLGIWISMR